jgi:hypothetical protein
MRIEEAIMRIRRGVRIRRRRGRRRRRNEGWEKLPNAWSVRGVTDFVYYIMGGVGV